MTRYKRIGDMVAAMKAGVIPVNVVSPGAAASALGITRQALHQRLRLGTLRAWSSEGVVLVDGNDLRRAVKEKQGIPPGQRVLRFGARPT